MICKSFLKTLPRKLAILFCVNTLLVWHIITHIVQINQGLSHDSVLTVLWQYYDSIMTVLAVLWQYYDSIGSINNVTRVTLRQRFKIILINIVNLYGYILTFISSRLFHKQCSVYCQRLFYYKQTQLKKFLQDLTKTRWGSLHNSTKERRWRNEKDLMTHIFISPSKAW